MSTSKSMSANTGSWTLVSIEKNTWNIVAPGLRVLAAHDAQQRIALRVVRALVDDRHRFAVAHVDGAGVLEDAREP